MLRKAMACTCSVPHGASQATCGCDSRPGAAMLGVSMPPAPCEVILYTASHSAGGQTLLGAVPPSPAGVPVAPAQVGFSPAGAPAAAHWSISAMSAADIG